MKREQLLILLAAGAAGFFSGLAAKKLSAGNSPGPIADLQERRSDEPRIEKTSATSALASFDREGRSQDTAESLLDLEAQDLLPRLALWLADAEEEEISAFWQQYREKTPMNTEIATLIFGSWAHFDPQGLIDRTKGGKDEGLAWMGWSIIDPDAALNEVMKQSPHLANVVVEAIGEIHPKWLRDHIDQIPQESRIFALQALESESDQTDPRGALDFLIEHGRGFRPDVFKSLARRDPWSAYDWLRENESIPTMIYGPGPESSASSELARILAEDDPGTLEKIARHAPPGKLKRTLEAALFQHLMQTNPEAAFAEAASIKAPFVAAERLAIAGNKLAATDPETSFRLAAQIFEKAPDAVSIFSNRIEVGNHTSLWGSQNTEVWQFIETLYQNDPARLLGMEGFHPKDGSSNSSIFMQMAGRWANDDPQGYVSWLDNQTDPEVLNNGSKALIQKQLQHKSYAEAADRALTLTTGKDDHIHQVIYHWGRSNNEEANAWLDTSGLPEPQVKTLKASLKSRP